MVQGQGSALARGPILIVGYGGIGDHIRCFALARHVAALYPDAPIDFLCRSPTDKLVQFVPGIRNAFVDDTPHGKIGLSHKFRLAARLRQQGYRRVYVVSRTLKAAIIPFLARIPERIGWFGEGRALLINKVRTGEGAIYGETEKVCALAFSTGKCTGLLPPVMRVDCAALAEWQRTTLGGAPTAPVLAIGPGAYNPARLWPAERFADIARDFAGRGWDVWVLGGPRERDVARAIAEVTPIRDFTMTPLDDAPFQLASATLFLGNDSGMLHIAGALGTQSVGLFGPTVLEVTGPRNPGVVEVRPPSGSIDLGDIPVAWVEKALSMRFACFERDMALTARAS